MGTWSITYTNGDIPPQEKASIDDNGTVKFGEHTEDTVYIIIYDEGEYKLRRRFKVSACPCACDYTLDFPNELEPDGSGCNCNSLVFVNQSQVIGSDTSEFIEVGVYSANTCVDTELMLRKENSYESNIIGDYYLDNGVIMAKVNENKSTDERTTTYVLFSTNEQCIASAELKQKGVECPCDETLIFYECEYRAEKPSDVTGINDCGATGAINGFSVTKICNGSEEPYTSYTIAWDSAPSGSFISLDGFNYTASTNCTTSSRSEDRRFSAYTEENTLIAEYIVSFIQNEGACSTCECQEYRYSATIQNPVTIGNCGGNSTISITNVQKQCTNPSRVPETITNYYIVWDSGTGDDFIAVNGSAYTATENCTEFPKQRTFTVKLYETGSDELIATSSITFDQEAGKCSTCDCTDYEYSAKCPSDVTGIGNCSTAGTINGFSVMRRCTSPASETYTPVTDYVIVWDDTQTGFISVSNLSYTADTNCTTSERRENRRFTAYTDSTRSTTITSCTVSFTQVAGPCSTCDCQNWEYSATIPTTVGNIQNCATSGTLGISHVQKQCTSPAGQPPQAISNYYVTWEHKSGYNFITGYGNTGYTVSANCTEDARQETLTVSVYESGTDKLIASSSVTFSQVAGKCGDCECTRWDYRKSGCPTTQITGIDVCGGNGTLGELVVEKRCASPESDWVTATMGIDYTLSWDEGFVTFDGLNYTVPANPTKQERSETRTLTITFGNGTTDRSCTVEFRQNSGTCEDLCNECDYIDLSLSETSKSIPSEATTDRTVSATSDCSNVALAVSVISGDTWLSASIDRNGVITVTATENEALQPRTGTIKVYVIGMEDCHKTLSVTQSARSCNCGDLQIQIV